MMMMLLLLLLLAVFKPSLWYLLPTTAPVPPVLEARANVVLLLPRPVASFSGIISWSPYHDRSPRSYSCFLAVCLLLALL
jgi:hypothetical protein